MLFSDCSFRLIIGSNANKFGVRHSIARYSNSKSEHFRAGTLGIQRGVMKGMRDVGHAAIIRDITFHVCPIIYLDASRDDTTDARYGGYPSLHITTQPRSRSTFKPGSWKLTAEEERIIPKAEGMVQEIAQAERFKGLRLVDLDRIAKCFRIYR